MKLGSGQLTFEEAEGWAKLPEGWDLGEVPGIAVDSKDRVYAFCRAENPVVIFHGMAAIWAPGEKGSS